MEKNDADANRQLTALQQLQQKPTEFLVVGIGASAGGIQALQAFFSQVPADSHMAYVVILHLSPDHDSQLANVLQQETEIPVTQVTGKTLIQPDHIYVVPPDRHLAIDAGHIEVLPNLHVQERRAPVDIFFRSLADHLGPRAISVVLSGTGANGSMGLKRIKERGGATYVQNPREAEFNEMPRNSIATDLVDEVLNVRDIPARIIAYRNSIGKVRILEEAEKSPEMQQRALREIFTQLRVRTGHDFSNYKRPTLLRRIERRINVHSLPDLPSYSAFLNEQPDEIHALLKDLLISVTNFFRDDKAFKSLEREILPAIFEGKTSADQVRIWVAGCATGEEAYSIAMLCAEQVLGILDAPKVQIFATDIDEPSIGSAREGLYTLNDAADVSPDRLHLFFNQDGDHFRVRREIREMILFASHNFLKDPPFSKLDLVTCRNVLIYLNRTAQERILETFHFSLRPKGFLFLGTSETVDSANDLYTVFNRDHHIFQAKEATYRSYPVPESVPNFHFSKTDKVQKTDEGESRAQGFSFGQLHQKMLEQYAPPSVVVDENYDIVHMSERVGKYLEFAGGEPSQNLLKLIRPQIRLELRSALYQAVQNKAAVQAQNIKLVLDGQQHSLDIQVRPVLDDGDAAKGYILVVFKPGESGVKEGAPFIPASDEPMAIQLEGELMGLKSQLRSSVELYEYQAEELKASNEELQAMNEELRSAAEELETSKEELQSINEELRTVNQELKVKIDETRITSNNLQNLVNSANVGTIFLDRSFAIRLFTPAVVDIFNLKSGDHGRPFTDITNNLQYDGLLQDAKTVLEKLTVVEREVTTTNNRSYMMRLLPYRTSEDRINGVVITFFDITSLKESVENLRQSEERLRLLIESAKDYAIFTLDNERCVATWSNGAEMMMGYSEPEMTGKSGDLIFTPEDREKQAPENEAQRAINGGIAINERWHLRKDGSRFWGSGSVSPILDKEGKLQGFVKIMRDLTEQRQMEQALHESDARFRTMANTAPVLLWEVDEKGLIFANGHYLDFVGTDFDTVIGTGWKQFLHPDDADAYISIIEKADINRRPYFSECRFLRADGQYRWLHNIGQPLGADRLVGCSIDITERKQKEANLAFLAKVNLGLAASLTVQEVMDRVCGELAGYLNLSRCHFAIVDEQEDSMEVVYEYRHNDALPSLLGAQRLSHNITEQGRLRYSTGEMSVISATANSPLLASQGDALNELGFASQINIPHIEDGRWRYLLTLGRAEVGDWQNDEVDLLQELSVKLFTRIERARAEEALRKSEQRLQLAARAGNLGTFVYYINEDRGEPDDQMLSLFGLPHDGTLNLREALNHIIHPEDREQYAREIALATDPKGSGELDSDIRIVLTDGTQRWINVAAKTYFEGNPPQAIKLTGVAIDITGRKQAEQTLQNFNSRLEQEVADRTEELRRNFTLIQTIYDTTLIGMSVFAPVRDEEGTITDFRIMMVNKKVERSARRKDLVGKLYSELYPGIKKMGLFDRMVKTLETGETAKLEYHYTYDGIDRWYSTTFIKGQDILVSTNLDITEQKITEDKRLRAYVLLQQSEELAGIGSWDYDLLTGKFAWSDGMYRLFNLRKGVEVKPEIYLKYATMDSRDTAARIVRHIEQGDADFEESMTISVGDTEKVLRLKASVIRNEKGHPVRVLGVDIDVTATRGAEERMRQLEAAQQTEIFKVTLRTQEEERRRISESLHNGLGQLLYGIKIGMDELTPLLAEQNDKAFASAKKYAEDLLTEAINESRRISHELMPMVLDDFGLAAAIKEICHQFREGVKFRSRVQLKGVKLNKYFELAVYRTVQELMLNVVKHANATTGLVEVIVKDSKVMIRVEDNGNGLAVQNGESTGIGLASIRSKANLLNGSVNFRDAPGGGTVAEVWLALDAHHNPS